MNQFAIDVEAGLSSEPKYLSSKYFYNKRGDELFQEIMDLDEYYLTRSEFEILENSKNCLLEHFAAEGDEFQLIEFGAGDGLKTKVLLSHFLDSQSKFKYRPIDISENALKNLKTDLVATYSNLEICGINSDYFSALHSLKDIKTRKVVVFLGSNIGNFTPLEASGFLQNMRNELTSGDLVLIGIDLKKDPALILNAYNDSEGVTREFNMNLLQRLNDELDADFVLDNFKHSPSYNPHTGAALSHIVSLKDQVVRVGVIDKKYSFDQGELILTEISQKYSIDQVEALAEEAGFSIVENFFDSNNYFVDTLWLVN